MNKPSLNLLKIGKFYVIIGLAKDEDKLQKIRNFLMEGCGLSESWMDEPIRAKEDVKMTEVVKEKNNVESLNTSSEVSLDSCEITIPVYVPDKPSVGVEDEPETPKIENEPEVVEFEDEPETVEAEDEPEFDALALFRNLDGKSSDDLITRFELDKMLPVRLDGLFDYCGIKVLPTDFKTYEEIPEISEIVDKKGLVLGAVAVNNNRINILYKKDASKHRQRFTVAHELAHCCLNAEELAIKGHVDFRLDIEEATEKATKKEFDANVFAGELLIPQKTLESLYKVIEKPKLKILANIFDVSENVMKARLNYLKLPFEDSIIV